LASNYRHCLLIAAALTVFPALGLRDAAGQEPAYPVKAVRAIVPYAPGGGTDIMSRALAQKLSEKWGQQVIVDNRGGGGTLIGTDLAARAAPDGYTLLITSTSFVINPAIGKKLPYDTFRDFDPITQVAYQPYILVVPPKVPARDVKEFIALGKAKPEMLNFGSTGTGSGSHLAGELFKMMSGMHMVHIPYKGMGPALADTLAGQTQALFGTVLSTTPHVKAGRLRALGMTTSTRSAALPEVPTIAEAGLPGYHATSWTGAYAPAGVPRTILTRINRDMVASLASPDMRERFAADGAEPAGGTPQELTAFLRSEISKWARVIKAATIHVE
jgi:tripartite-type tricarboxylate transporter receptor subunit TctC